MLFLACHLPYPTISGGRKREYELLARIGRRVDVHLAVVSKTYEEDLSNAHELEGFCRSVTIFPAKPPVVRDPSLPWQVQRHRCPGLTRHIRAVIDDVDLVHLEGYYLAQHLPATRRVPAILVEQNVEYLLCKQRLESARSRERQLALLDYLRSLEAETTAWRTADHLAAVTVEDASYIRHAVGGSDVSIIPDGIDIREPESSHPDVHSPSIAFVANFAYEPNVDAAIYLCRSLLPLIRRSVPAVSVWLVGNAPPDAVRALEGPRVMITGRVPNVGPYLTAADVVVCPLRIGGGVKVKILEALAHGKAIVTTSVGTQGIDGSIPAAVRDEPVQFALAASSLLADAYARRKLGAAALTFARSLPTWDDAAQALLGLYEQAAGTSGRDVRGVVTA